MDNVAVLFSQLEPIPQLHGHLCQPNMMFIGTMIGPLRYYFPNIKLGNVLHNKYENALNSPRNEKKTGRG